MSDLNDLNKETHEAWEENADVWDNRMGDEGNEFFNILCWPALASLLDLRPDSHILDIACGNGLTTCRLAELGPQVTARKSCFTRHFSRHRRYGRISTSLPQ